MLVKKYEPHSFSEIVGQKDYSSLIINYSKPIIITGIPGCGKTSSVYAIAKDLDMDVFEINSSDMRNKKNLEALIPMLKQKSLFGRSKIVLIDDVDALTSVDRGGTSGILEIVKSTIFPVVMTANDISDRKYKNIRKASIIVEFQPISDKDIKAKLKEIAKSEGSDVSDAVINDICMSSRGDLRSAINDLEAVLWSDGDSSVLSRDFVRSTHDTLESIFMQHSFDLIHVFDRSELSYDDAILWIEQNLSALPESNYIKAMKRISRADYFIQSINVNQYWRFLVYVFFNLSVGVGASKTTPIKIRKFKEPNIILLKWIGNNSRRTRNSILQKVSEKLDLSTKDLIPLFYVLNEIFIKNESFNEFEFDDKEKEYIKAHTLSVSVRR